MQGLIGLSLASFFTVFVQPKAQLSKYITPLFLPVTPLLHQSVLPPPVRCQERICLTAHGSGFTNVWVQSDGVSSGNHGETEEDFGNSCSSHVTFFLKMPNQFKAIFQLGHAHRAQKIIKFYSRKFVPVPLLLHCLSLTDALFSLLSSAKKSSESLCVSHISETVKLKTVKNLFGRILSIC